MKIHAEYRDFQLLDQEFDFLDSCDEICLTKGLQHDLAIHAGY